MFSSAKTHRQRFCNACQDLIGQDWMEKKCIKNIVVSCNGILIIITDWLSFGYFIWEEFWGFADLQLFSLDASAERDPEGGLDRRQVSSDFCSIINNVNSVCALLIMLIYLSVSLMTTSKGQDRWVIHQCVCVFVCFELCLHIHIQVQTYFNVGLGQCPRKKVNIVMFNIVMS